MFKKIINLINEIHYTDYYPKQFVNFVEKYKTQNLDNLYIHFSNFKADVLDKRIAYDPAGTHDDPAGVYAFPADYVVSHPSDIGFGTNRKYLAVIRNRAPDQTLYLQDINKEQFIYYLDKMFPKENWDLNAVYQNYIVLRGMRTGAYLYRKLYGFMDDKKRTPKEMNEILVRAGIKVLVDNAEDRSSHIIHPDEPHQAIFLTRDSFEIVETFQLRQEKATGKITQVRDEYLETNIVEKMLGMLANKLGDRFKIVKNYPYGGKFLRTTIGFKGKLFSGMITIYYNNSKEHKDYKEYSDIQIDISIGKREDKKRISFEFSGDTKIEDMINKIYNSLT